MMPWLWGAFFMYSSAVCGFVVAEWEAASEVRNVTAMLTHALASMVMCWCVSWESESAIGGRLTEFEQWTV